MGLITVTAIYDGVGNFYPEGKMFTISTDSVLQPIKYLPIANSIPGTTGPVDTYPLICVKTEEFGELCMNITLEEWEDLLREATTNSVPLNRELTIDGDTQNLAEDRTWNTGGGGGQNLEQVTQIGNTTPYPIIYTSPGGIPLAGIGGIGISGITAVSAASLNNNVSAVLFASEDGTSAGLILASDVASNQRFLFTGIPTAARTIIVPDDNGTILLNEQVGRGVSGQLDSGSVIVNTPLAKFNSIITITPLDFPIITQTTFTVSRGLGSFTIIDQLGTADNDGMRFMWNLYNI